METKTNQNQIVITLHSEEKKQKLPTQFIVTLAFGLLTGIGIILGLFMAAQLLLGL